LNRADIPNWGNDELPHADPIERRTYSRARAVQIGFERRSIALGVMIRKLGLGEDAERAR